jgi:hypothetical protein
MRFFITGMLIFMLTGSQPVSMNEERAQVLCAQFHSELYVTDHVLFLYQVD